MQPRYIAVLSRTQLLFWARTLASTSTVVWDVTPRLSSRRQCRNRPCSPFSPSASLDLAGTGADEPERNTDYRIASEGFLLLYFGRERARAQRLAVCPAG